MIQQIKRLALRILMLTLLLVMLSLLISYAAGESALSLKDILFWVGAFPIALFSITILGGISSRGERNDQSTEVTSHQAPQQRLIPGRSTAAKQTSSGLAWIIAGLFVWLVSYVI